MASARCDVLVVGAGPAGVAAAVAAAERGASVTLLERSDHLGGSVTDGMHRCLCGLYAARPKDPENTLNGGIQQRVTQQLYRRAPDVTAVRQLGRTWVLEFAQEAWRATLAKLLEDAGVVVRLGCGVRSVELAGNRIGVVVMKAGERVEAGAVVDCTGVGTVVEMAGAAQEANPRQQRMLGGVAMRVRGIRGNGEMLHLQVPYALRMAAERGELPREAAFAVFGAGPGEGEGLCKLAVPAGADVDAGELARAAMGILRGGLQEMAEAEVVAVSPRVLARDGRRLLGEVMLGEEDVLGGRVCAGRAGEAVRAWWPVEYWSSEQGPIYRYPPEGQAYAIGAGAVRSVRIANLLAAGASLSATAMAAASARAGGICLGTGEMAGALAARCCGMGSA